MAGFAADGSVFAAISNVGIHVWDARTWDELQPQTGQGRGGTQPRNRAGRPRFQSKRRYFLGTSSTSQTPLSEQ
jgi:hypothetical protein